MPRSSAVAEFKRLSKVLVCTLALCQLGFSQGSGASLESTRLKLATLQTCLGPDNTAIGELTKGLLAGWGKWKNAPTTHVGPPTPPPAEYLDSLDRDISACVFAAQVKDEAQRQIILRAVGRDIAIKAEDCQKFGMGRNVSVRVTTMRLISLEGPTAENGWEVFYKWNCSSDFQPEEMRAAQLTSPAILQLPPGSYSIRAQKREQKKNSATQFLKTEPAVIVVGSQPTIDVQLPTQ
jgi:hypothetical protein